MVSERRRGCYAAVVGDRSTLFSVIIFCCSINSGLTMEARRTSPMYARHWSSKSGVLNPPAAASTAPRPHHGSSSSIPGMSSIKRTQNVAALKCGDERQEDSDLELLGNDEKEENSDLEDLGNDTVDFEFRLPTDELLSDGKLLPLQLPRIRLPAMSIAEATVMEVKLPDTPEMKTRNEISSSELCVLSVSSFLSAISVNGGGGNLFVHLSDSRLSFPVLSSIGLLLSEPDPDDGLMHDASEEYKYDRQVFKQKARSMTEKFARAQASEDAGSVSHQEIQSRINPDMEKVEYKGLDASKSNAIQCFLSQNRLCGVSRKLSLDSSRLKQHRISIERVTGLTILCLSDNQLEAGYPFRNEISSLEPWTECLGLKKLDLSSENSLRMMKFTVLREIKQLKELKDPNIIELFCAKHYDPGVSDTKEGTNKFKYHIMKFSEHKTLSLLESVNTNLAANETPAQVKKLKQAEPAKGHLNVDAPLIDTGDNKQTDQGSTTQ